MRKLALLCLTLVCAITMNAQELKIIEFRADLTMTDAAKNPVKDANGVNCGLIKLGLVIPDAEFEGDFLSTEYNNGEWLIYMMNGANWLTVKTKQYLPLRHEFDPIQSNVTYVMVVEIPASDSTDYFLEQARMAVAANDMAKFIQYIEKVPKTDVPSDLLAIYNNTLAAKAENDLYLSLKQKTYNFTAIPNKDAFNQCRTFITKYPKSEHYATVSNLLRTEGKKFLQGQNGNNQNTSSSTKTTSKSSSSSKPVVAPTPRKKAAYGSLLTIGVGADPFLTLPDSSKVDYDTAKFYGGIEANVVLRIGRPHNTVNGLLGVGTSVGSFLKPNLHLAPEIRLNFDESLFVGLGGEISLLTFGKTSADNTTAKAQSTGNSVKIVAGYREERFDLYLTVRILDKTIGGFAGGVGFRWYLF
ncbi:MAG: hypothetical protein IJK36_05150 [Bacteroidales bacterium]|nr:hypothetical protein [Bacteroidales bacterium]